MRMPHAAQPKAECFVREDAQGAGALGTCVIGDYMEDQFQCYDLILSPVTANVTPTTRWAAPVSPCWPMSAGNRPYHCR
ncbi:hypothetical protein Pfra02_34930 [Pseudomonas fragi]|nr:hypothetical protein Pfra02_34930 [Pseudomonas fragi]